MAQFEKNERFDPYKNFKFRVFFGDSTDAVAGVSKVGGLRRTTEVITHREGGDSSTSRKSPGRTEYEAITLERGVTHDKDFEKWANQVWNYRKSTADPNQRIEEMALANFRKNITIKLFNEAGQPVLAYVVHRCWVSEYQSLPELDANANAIAIQSIKLENEGWERVEPPVEPKETKFE